MHSAPLTILRIKQVMARTGMGRSSIYERARRDPTFPKQVKLGVMTAGWVESEIDAWLSAQIDRSRSASGGKHGT